MEGSRFEVEKASLAVSLDEPVRAAGEVAWLAIAMASHASRSPKRDG
jgi:hypothetical protein